MLKQVSSCCTQLLYCCCERPSLDTYSLGLSTSSTLSDFSLFLSLPPSSRKCRRGGLDSTKGRGRERQPERKRVAERLNGVRVFAREHQREWDCCNTILETHDTTTGSRHLMCDISTFANTDLRFRSWRLPTRSRSRSPRPLSSRPSLSRLRLRLRLRLIAAARLRAVQPLLSRQSAVQGYRYTYTEYSYPNRSNDCCCSCVQAKYQGR